MLNQDNIKYFLNISQDLDHINKPYIASEENIVETPIEERFERITRLCCELFDVPISEIIIADEDRLWFKSAQGDNANECQRKNSFCDFVITNDTQLIVTNAIEDSRFSNHPLVCGESHIRFYAGHPIKGTNGQNIGTLCILDKKERYFNNKSRAFLEDLAVLVETELNNISLGTTQHTLIQEINKAHRQSLLDPLTRLWNRRGMNEILLREYEAMLRKGGLLGLIMLDLDHFKQINDSHGHLVGDEVLQQIAKRLIRAIRVYDSVGRFGGEEFTIAMHSYDIDTFTYAAERILENLNSQPIETSIGEITVTASLGVAYIDQQSTKNIEELINCADNAMYRAKSLSRNRIEYGTCFTSKRIISVNNK